MFGDFLGYFEVCQFLRKETTQVSLWANLGCFQFQHLVTLEVSVQWSKLQKGYDCKLCRSRHQLVGVCVCMPKPKVYH